jgi:LAS superfamily LD-carboxypeptidase LdcB
MKSWQLAACLPDRQVSSRQLSLANATEDKSAVSSWQYLLTPNFYILTAFVLLLLSIKVVSGQTIDKKYLLGQFDETKDNWFVKIDSQYARGSAVGKFLRKESYEAFVKMANAAKKEGVILFIISATRNFTSQKSIWENKWNGKTLVEGKNLTTIADLPERAKMILLYSSMPGTSRHHWGTDMDLNSLDNSYFASGEGLKIYQWLQVHAAEFDFCQPYTSKATGRSGYEEEKWHWSYLPLSKELLKEYKKQIRYADISGFKGSEVAKKLKVIDSYVDGVACK